MYTDPVSPTVSNILLILNWTHCILKKCVLDEERGKTIDNYPISIYRRWNKENKITTVLCRIDHPEGDCSFSDTVFEEAMNYTIQKLNQDHEKDSSSIIDLKIFYSITKNVESSLFVNYFEDIITKDLALSYTLVPVILLRNQHTFVSICGVRIP